MTNRIEGKLYPSGPGANIHLNAQLVNDSLFPFKLGEKITISIDNDSLVIKKVEL